MTHPHHIIALLIESAESVVSDGKFIEYSPRLETERGVMMIDVFHGRATHTIEAIISLMESASASASSMVWASL